MAADAAFSINAVAASSDHPTASTPLLQAPSAGIGASLESDARRSALRRSILHDFQDGVSSANHEITTADLAPIAVESMPSIFLGIPHRLRRRWQHHHNHHDSSLPEHEEPDIVTSQLQRFSYVTLLFMALVAFLSVGGGLILLRHGQNARHIGFQMLYYACGAVIFLCMRAALTLLFWYLEPRVYLSRLFFLAEGEQTDLGLIAYGVLSLGVTPFTFAPRLCGPQFMEANFRINVTLVVVFSASFVKCVFERLWLENVHRDMFGRELASIIADEKIICHLCTCAPTNSSRWQTPASPPHTHDFSATLRALLGNALPGDFHSRDDRELRADALRRGRDILMNLDLDGKGYFTFRDLTMVARGDAAKARRMMLAFTPAAVDEAAVNEDDIVTALYELHRRRAETFSLLHDRGQMGAVLHAFTGALFWLVATLFGLTVFGFDVLTLILPVATSFIGLAFVFGSSAAAAFTGFLFIFVVRSLSGGDRFTIPNFPTLIVDRFHVFTTICHSPDGRQFIIPNSLLFTTPITQYRRSKEYAVTVSFQLPPSTQSSQIVDFIDRVRGWLDADRKFRVDPESFMYWVDALTDTAPATLTGNTLTLNLWIGLKGVTWQNVKAYLGARTAILMHCKDLLQQLGMIVAMPERPMTVVLRNELTPGTGLAAAAAAAGLAGSAAGLGGAVAAAMGGRDRELIDLKTAGR